MVPAGGTGFAFGHFCTDTRFVGFVTVNGPVFSGPFFDGIEYLPGRFPTMLFYHFFQQQPGTISLPPADHLPDQAGKFLNVQSIGHELSSFHVAA